MPAQPSYEQGLEEALKAQVGLLKGTGGFAEIAPEGLAGLVPLEAEVRQLSTQADTDAIQTALLGGFTVADSQGRVIKAYSDKPMQGGSNWDNWAPTVQQDMENALDAIWLLGHNPEASYRTFGSGQDHRAGIKLLRQMGYDIPVDAKDPNFPNDPGRATAAASIDQFFKDAGWEKGTLGKPGMFGGTGEKIVGGGHDNKSGYERVIAAGADVPREPIFDEKTYEPGAKVRDPLQPGLVDLLGSSEPMERSGRTDEQQAQFLENVEIIHQYENRPPQSGPRPPTGWTYPTDEEYAAAIDARDELQALGEPTSRKPGFDSNGQFLGLSKLGEDLRIQGASAGRAADIADIEVNLDRFTEIMEKVRPETTQALDDAVKVIDEQGKRLMGTPPTFEEWKAQGMIGRDTDPRTGEPIIRIDPIEGGQSDQQIYDDLIASGELKGEAFSISEPKSMEKLATSIQRLPPGEADKLAPELRAASGLETVTTAASAKADQVSGYGDFGTGMDPLRSSLLTDAKSDLAAGRGLTDRQRTEAIQTAREGWEARGRVRDPAAVVAEVESVMEARGVEEARRRAFAGDVLAREAGLQTGELGRGMAAEQFNVQNEINRLEANLGRQLTADEFNVVQESARQESNALRQMAADEYNIGQDVARQEANIGRQMSAGMTDVGAKMDQERLNEQLRQQGIMGYMGATTQLAALQDIQQQKLDPFQAIVGRPSSSGVPGFGMGQQIGGTAQYGLTAGPQYVSPESGLGYIQSQAANQANMWAAQQQAKATQSAGLMGALGSIGGGLATGFIMK
jgi:hypothetical protein